MTTKTTVARRLTRTAYPPGVDGRHKQRFKDSDECAHRFASFTQEEGRSTNTYFSRGTYYSYGRHFPVARFVAHGRQRFVLFTTRTYSSTTRGHCYSMERALRGQPFYRVDNVCADSRSEHLHNFRLLEKEAKELAARSARARVNGEFLIEQSVKTIESANAYAAAVGLRERLTVPDPAEVAAFAAECRVRADAINAKEREKHEKANRLRSERLAVDTAKWEQGLESWKAGGEWPGHCPDPCHPLARLTFLRVRGKRLETSQRAVVPLAAVLPVLEIVRSGVDYARDTGAPGVHGVGLQVDGFELSSVDHAARIVTIGCHTVNFDEIERVAALAKL